MNTMTRCLSGAAAVAIHPHRCEVRREPPTLSLTRPGRRELGETREVAGLHRHIK